jgi:hypothetical protein
MEAQYNQQLMVPGGGLEPPRPDKGLRILSPLCLPISPSGQSLCSIPAGFASPRHDQELYNIVAGVYQGKSWDGSDVRRAAVAFSELAKQTLDQGQSTGRGCVKCGWKRGRLANQS